MKEKNIKTIYLAGGCFWGMQKYIDQFDGVLSTEVGFANGKTLTPTYRDVCDKDTGHAETVKISYDEDKISLTYLLDQYFAVIDPFSVNKQGEDEGTQYRTGIFWDDESLESPIKEYMEKKEKELGRKTALILSPIQNYYPAEEYHQKYLDKHVDGYCHIPREKLRKRQ